MTPNMPNRVRADQREEQDGSRQIDGILLNRGASAHSFELLHGEIEQDHPQSELWADASASKTPGSRQ